MVIPSFLCIHICLLISEVSRQPDTAASRTACQHYTIRHVISEAKYIDPQYRFSGREADAYIQDVMVAPEFQEKGIGTELMNRAMSEIKARGIYMISVIYGEEKLRRFYEKYGFCTMLCGQLETRLEK